MKRLGWMLLLLATAVPAWSAKKITVGELTDTLKSMQQEKKSDADVSAALKQIQLTEQLTRNVMNSLSDCVPGPLSTEQLYVLEARSALLPPPSADIPATPAPEAVAQKALLDKTSEYLTKIYEQMPALSATKTTLRFQDNVETVAASSGMHGSATDVSVGSAIVTASKFIHYINATESMVTSEHGAEKMPSAKDKTPWGANKMIALQEPDPSDGEVFQEAQGAGTIKWLRWETVNGKTAAVFSFEVAKKKSHFNMNVCCFPDVDQTGTVHFSGMQRVGQSVGAAGSGSGPTGNLQTNTDWHNYKATVPYHGEFFIDPDTGIVLRMITEAELKPTDVVHQQDTRIDYGPVTVGGKTMMLPVKLFVVSEVVPNGDSSAGSYSTRCTLFTAEYKNYQIAGATAQK